MASRFTTKMVNVHGVDTCWLLSTIVSFSTCYCQKIWYVIARNIL